MMFVYIKTIQLGVKRVIPYQILVAPFENSEEKIVFTIRPEVTVPKRIYELNNLNRLELLIAEPFCNIVDELLDIFKFQELVFSEMAQFRILKSLFTTIGYNFNVKPKIIWKSEAFRRKKVDTQLGKHSNESLEYLDFLFTKIMEHLSSEKTKLENYKSQYIDSLDLKISNFSTKPGVYFFLNESGQIIYVGKAKNVRKRLQSHFSNSEKKSNIDYSEVENIEVEYTGNDIIAQLIESEHIKSLKPKYNSQQVNAKAPFVMYHFDTAKGISKIKISRKETQDTFPEKYFNKNSVKRALISFCDTYTLCRKYCGIETIKGGCSRTTSHSLSCVCNGSEPIPQYNRRLKTAIKDFERKKSRKIYKLQGRTSNEDAFVYLVNDVYEGYGFIEKNEIISTNNDILNHLNVRENNYETARIVDSLRKSASPNNLICL